MWAQVTLNLVKEPYKYLLGVRVRVSMTLVSRLPPLEIENQRLFPSKVRSVECHA